MPTQVQFRRGTTAQNNSFTGAAGELSVDTDLDVIRVHDGATAGGFALVGATATQTLTNKTLTTPTITGASITASSIATSTLNANGTATVNALTSNGAVSGTTGTFTSTLTTVGIVPSSNAASNIGSTTAYYNGVFAVQYSVGTGGIVNLGANATGNIGSSTSYFNTVFAKATSAQYADLAERYQADAEYEPGTVMVFGGGHEVTQSTKDHDSAIAGVVSTDPAYLMNSGLDTINSVSLALVGRVPCRVQGPVSKGSVLVSGSVPGTAQAIINTKFEPGCIIGKAMQAIPDTSIQLIEIAVGRS